MGVRYVNKLHEVLGLESLVGKWKVRVSYNIVDIFVQVDARLLRESTGQRLVDLASTTLLPWQASCLF